MRTIQQDSHSDGIIKVKKNGGEKRPVIRDVTRLKGFVKIFPLLTCTVLYCQYALVQK